MRIAQPTGVVFCGLWITLTSERIGLCRSHLTVRMYISLVARFEVTGLTRTIRHESLAFLQFLK